MRKILRQGAVAVIVLGAVLLGLPPGKSEVSVDARDGRATGLALLRANQGGGGGMPWPQVRDHVDPARILNPSGNDRTPPDGEPALGWDPLGERPEVAWARHDGTDYEVVIASWVGTHWSSPRALTSNEVDDRDPDLAYGPDGTARVAFEREGRVFIVRRPPGGEWSAPEEVADGRAPSVARTVEERVAYQHAAESGSEKQIVVSRRVGEGAWVPEIVATTNFDGLEGNGDVDVRLHASADGHVWVDWEDSADSLGWCELQESGTWSAPRWEPMANPDDEEAARLRIELQVLR